MDVRPGIRPMTKESLLNTITTKNIKERLALMSADDVESYVERIAIMHVDGRLPIYQAEHEALQLMKRSWQKQEINVNMKTMI